MDLLDVSTSKHLNRARDNKEIEKTFSRIDELIAAAKVTRITLSGKMYSEITSHFPNDMRMHMLDGFQYKDSTIIPLK
jgi:hypothetical protein